MTPRAAGAPGAGAPSSRPAAPPAAGGTPAGSAAPADRIELSDEAKALAAAVPSAANDARLEAIARRIAAGHYESDEVLRVVVERLLHEFGHGADGT